MTGGERGGAALPGLGQRRWKGGQGNGWNGLGEPLRQAHGGKELGAKSGDHAENLWGKKGGELGRHARVQESERGLRAGGGTARGPGPKGWGKDRSTGQGERTVGRIERGFRRGSRKNAQQKLRGAL